MYLSHNNFSQHSTNLPYLALWVLYMVQNYHQMRVTNFSDLMEEYIILIVNLFLIFHFENYHTFNCKVVLFAASFINFSFDLISLFRFHVCVEIQRPFVVLTNFLKFSRLLFLVGQMAIPVILTFLLFFRPSSGLIYSSKYSQRLDLFQA